MRTNNLMDPRSWRAWDGKAYTKSMVSPYTMEAGTESDHVCTVTNLPAGTCIPIKGKERGCQAAGIVWSTYLEKFVVTLGCGERQACTAVVPVSQLPRARSHTPVGA